MVSFLRLYWKKHQQWHSPPIYGKEELENISFHWLLICLMINLKSFHSCYPWDNSINVIWRSMFKHLSHSSYMINIKLRLTKDLASQQTVAAKWLQQHQVVILVQDMHVLLTFGTMLWKMAYVYGHHLILRSKCFLLYMKDELKNWIKPIHLTKPRKSAVNVFYIEQKIRVSAVSLPAIEFICLE